MVRPSQTGTVESVARSSRTVSATVPVWDGLTTALSLAATYGQCRKLVESWWLWIAADIVYIPLYAYKELYLTSLLYAGFLTLCLIGLRNWRRDLAAPTPRPAKALA